MSKKTLKDSLESLFSLPEVDVMDETAFLGDNVEPATTRKSRKNRKSKTRTRSGSSSKSFTADLESLFSNVVSDSVEDQKTKRKEKPIGFINRKPNSGNRPARRPMGGLNALIRDTVEPNKLEIQRAAVPKEKKRVTFVFDKKKLMQLKKIAKMEKAYLKDIIGGLISEYLEEYDGNKNKLNRAK